MNKLFFTAILLALFGQTALAQVFDRSSNTNTAGQAPAAPVADNLQEAADPLGRPYRPVIGWLDPVVYNSVPPAIGKNLGVSFLNGVKGNAYTPYSLVQKTELEVAALSAQFKSKEELRQQYQAETVGAHYLCQLEVLNFKTYTVVDTLPAEKPGAPRKTKNIFVCTANMTARLTDVTTTKIVLVSNFDLQADSKTAPQLPNQTDSSFTVQSLYSQARAEGGKIFVNLVSGLGKVTGISKEDDEKAKEVTVNQNDLMTLSNKGQYFDVYALKESLEANGQLFTQMEQIGNVSKPNNYDFKARNFEVERGGKNIWAAVKGGQTLVCSKGPVPMRPLLPGSNRPSIVVEPFKTKITFPEFRMRMLEDAIREYLSRYPQLLDMVDRDLYSIIEAERTIQSKMKSDATQAGVTIGADYLVAADIVSYNFTREVLKKAKEEPPPAKPAQPAPAVVAAQPNKTDPSKPNVDQKKGKTDGSNGASGATSAQGTTTTPATTKPAAQTQPQPEKKPAVVFKNTEMVPYGIKGNANLALDVRVVSVKTGEIIWNQTFKAQGTKEFPLDQSTTAQIRQEVETLRALVANAGPQIGGPLFARLNGQSPLLKILESKNGEAKEVLIGGGSFGGVFDGEFFDVVQVSEEEVDGQKLTRDEVIGELRVKEVYSETSVCKVTDGNDKVQQGIDGKSRVYCRRKTRQ